MTSTVCCPNMVVLSAPRRRDGFMEQDENREPKTDDMEAEDLEVTTDEAEGVAGGLRAPSDPDAGAQRL